MLWSIIGSSAAILTMFAFVPQVVKVLKTKSIKDISIATLVQLSIGVILWILYGIHKKDIIIITANAVTLATMVTLLLIYVDFRKRYR